LTEANNFFQKPRIVFSQFYRGEKGRLKT